MRKALPALLYFFLVVVCILSIPHIFSPVRIKFRPFTKNDGMGKAWEQEYLMTRNPKTGKVPREKLLEAMQFRDEKLSRLGMERAVAGLAWEDRGPYNVGGRTRAVHFDMADQANGYKKVWAGGVAGGLWYTNDITAAIPAWQQVNDLFENMAVSSITQDPTNFNIMYFGTGEGWGNFDAMGGMGIWKTTNGGITWSRLSATNNSNFRYSQKLMATNSGALLAATTTGIYRSADNGSSFTKILGAGVGGASINGAADIEKAANGHLYASLGIYGSQDGVYRSTDDGLTWDKIYTTLSNEARIDLACAPSNANYIYAAISGNSGTAYRKTIRTSNATDPTPVWTTLAMPSWCDAGTPNADISRGQSWYDLIGMVDPSNPDAYYLGTVDILKTTNGGTSWTQITQWANGCASGVYVHADMHAMAANPGNPQQVLIGCDGGLFLTNNGGASFSSRNYGYNITQFYSVATHPTNPNYFLAGAQDNGTQQFSGSGTNTTREVSGGDGAFCFIDQDNPSIQISSYVYNNYYVSTDGGASFASRSLNNSGQFINSGDYDDAANILYSANTSGTFMRWNNVATGNPVLDTNWVNVSSFGGARPTYIGVSPITANRVYFGLPNGTVLYTDNSHTGTAQTGTIIKTAVSSPVSCVAIDPANENHILVTHSSYGVTSVYETSNALSGAPTWTAVEGDLPDMPVRWAMFDPRNSDWAILATELGIWSTDNLNGASTEWNPTNQGLANVRVDMLQYSPATRVLAAATHGRGLFSATVPAGGGAEINFQHTSLQESEWAATISDCRRYKDYPIQLTIGAAPTGNATVTISADGSSTATRYLDYDFSTTGDFSAPSNTLLFENGATTAKTCYLRIYDDKAVESAETAVLNFSISGTTNATAGTASQLVFTISENDLLPTTGTTTTHDTGPSTAQSNILGPFLGTNTRGRFQYMVYATELLADGLKAGPINSLGMYVTAKNSTGAFEDLTLKIGHTHSTGLNYGFLSNSLQTVFSADYTTTANMNTLAFSAPFEWNGRDNLVVEFCYNNTTAVGADDILLEQNPNPSSGDLPIVFVSSNAGQACTLNATSTVNFRPTFEFTQTIDQTPVAGSLSVSASEYLGPLQETYFYTSDGQLLAKIKNLETHDYGCTQVSVNRAGTGSTAFWNNNTAHYLADKTIRIVPANNNPTGDVEITVYYTAAEKQGWELATGNNWSNISLVKVPSVISAVTPATPYPDGPGTVQVVVPSRTNLGTHYALSYTFENGFSGIGAGIPGAALPVTMMDFTGKIKSGFSWLQWNTATEESNKGFYIERSYDNQLFQTIGFVKGANNSNTIRRYEFKDPDMARSFNYYRLKQEDANGKHQYSATILLRQENPGGNISLLENPVRNNLGLNIGKAFTKQVRIKVVDLAGRTLETWQFTELPAQKLWLPVQKEWTKGTYIVVIESGDERYSLKAIR